MRETHRQHFNGTVGSTRGSFRRSTGIALRDQSGHWRHPERKLREERQIRSGEDQGLKAMKNRTQLNSVHSLGCGEASCAHNEVKLENYRTGHKGSRNVKTVSKRIAQAVRLNLRDHGCGVPTLSPASPAEMKRMLRGLSYTEAQIETGLKMQVSFIYFGVLHYDFFFLLPSFFVIKASRKRGLSADEKKSRLLQLFYESNEFFLMKELERRAPKEKGIVPQSVKEVTQLLVDEGLVECEKIGTLSCFWAFPSKATQTRKRKLEDLDAKIGEAKKKVESLKEEVNKARLGKEETKERAKLILRYSSLRDTLSELRQKRIKLDESGPEAIMRAESSASAARDAVNRWTDNIFAIKKWCKKKFAMEEKCLDNQFGIDPDMDYVD
ncbi:unnamed protein product [Enterobius vermicularis]|uniref:Meiotic nuclear division protein 1 homolog n=1 Tax=Enterobius vermicularis TaxID=51028 RepID=A0A0N4V8F0_ENTVE|nr:unnamed protein product [Enterobius vermicularis]